MTDAKNQFGSGEFGNQFSSSLLADAKGLITQVLKAAGIEEQDPDYRDRALTFLNMVYLNRLKGRHWKFTNRELFIDLMGPYSAGTVALTEGSYVATESVDIDNGAVPLIQLNANMLGQQFCPNQRDQDFYRIRKLNTLKEFELASMYAGDDAAFSEYQILYDRHQLDPKVQAVRSLSVTGIGEIKPLGLQKFREMKSRDPCRTGPPEWYTLTQTENQSGQWTIEFFPSPDRRYSCHIEYTERPTQLEDSDTCYHLVPPEHIDVLYYGVLAEVYRYQENPAMLAETSKMAANSWSRMAGDQEMTDSVARIQHRRRYFNRTRRKYPGFFGLNWFGRVDD